MILILTGPGDKHADHVAAKLRERGAYFVRFNPAQFPREAEISLSYSPSGRSNYMLRVGEELADLNSLRAVWYRRPEPPVAHGEIGDDLVRDFVKQECNTFVQDLWSSLDCLWLPPRLPPLDGHSSRLRS